MEFAHSYRRDPRAGLNQAGPDKQRRETMNMKMHNQGVRFTLACLLLIFGIAWASPVQADVTYSGRAFGAFVDVPTLGVNSQYISDTGELSADGAPRSAALVDGG